MTPTEHLIAFVAMTGAIVAILVVGTLAAADILHFGRRVRGSGTSAPVRRADIRSAPYSGEHRKQLVTSTVGHARTDQ